jgi:hypothetical protein
METDGNHPPKKRKRGDYIVIDYLSLHLLRNRYYTILDLDTTATRKKKERKRRRREKREKKRKGRSH